jgi:hypothetical protein
MGLGSERLFACDLDGPEGRAALNRLTRDASSRSGEGPPLDAFTAYLKASTSRADLEARWLTPMSGSGR